LNYVEFSSKLKGILGLRWSPVAVKFVGIDDQLPSDVPRPWGRLYVCQAVALAKRGKTLLLTPDRCKCPDGGPILGLMRTPDRIKRGEYHSSVRAFGKFASAKEARRIVSERPSFAECSVKAVVFAPLESSPVDPDVVIVILNPEQAMWICIAATYFTGERLEFSTSGHNSLCSDCMVVPHQTGKMNISFGDYGCRGSTEICDSEMFVGIPWGLMPRIVEALERLSKKAIPDSRNKIYMSIYGRTRV